MRTRANVRTTDGPSFKRRPCDGASNIVKFRRLATSVAGPTYVCLCLLTLAPLNADAAEGALGRPISGTYVAPNVGVVPPEPIWITNLGEI